MAEFEVGEIVRLVLTNGDCDEACVCYLGREVEVIDAAFIYRGDRWHTIRAADGYVMTATIANLKRIPPADDVSWRAIEELTHWQPKELVRV